MCFIPNYPFLFLYYKLCCTVVKVVPKCYTEVYCGSYILVNHSMIYIYTGFNQQLNSVVINHLSIEDIRTCILRVLYQHNSTLATR